MKLLLKAIAKAELAQPPGIIRPLEKPPVPRLTRSTPLRSSPLDEKSKAIIFKNDIDEVSALLKGNPDLVFSEDENGYAPLHFAVIRHYKEVAELLLTGNADVEAKTDSGTRALHFATGFMTPGSKELAELLLANGADVNATEELHSYTPLHCAAAAGYKDVAELLLARGAAINAQNYLGKTPLHLAAYFGHTGVTELLIANRADVNAKDHLGHTPRWVAEIDGGSDKSRKAVAALLRKNRGKLY